MILGLLAQLVVILIAARIGGLLARALKQPAVVGEMTAGILLGQFAPQWFGSTEVLTSLSQIGLILFLFVVGLRLNTQHLAGSGRLVIVTSLVSIVVPFTLGTALGFFIHPTLGTGTPVVLFSLFIGVATSITAFPVLARILRERRMENTPLGTIAIACAAVDDVSAWLILAGILAFAHSGKPLPVVFALLCLYLLIIWFFLRKLAVNWPAESLTPILLAAFTSSLATEWIGLHAFFGAIAAGAAMPKRPEWVERVAQKLEPLTLELLLPPFFVLTGFRAHLALLHGWTTWAICLAILCVAILGKCGGGMIAARYMGMKWRDSAALGILMNTRGLVELIALNLGLEAGIIPPTVFSLMVIMALVTTLMTTPLLNLIQEKPLT